MTRAEQLRRHISLWLWCSSSSGCQRRHGHSSAARTGPAGASGGAQKTVRSRCGSCGCGMAWLSRTPATRSSPTARTGWRSGILPSPSRSSGRCASRSATLGTHLRPPCLRPCPPWALVFGSLRGIPFFWRLVDCSFGVFGFLPLWLCRTRCGCPGAPGGGIISHYGNFQGNAGGRGRHGAGVGEESPEHPDVQVAGWVDIRPARRRRRRTPWGCPSRTPANDLGRALAEQTPDFVVDVTVPEAHRELTLQALAAGVPVLVRSRWRRAWNRPARW